MGLPPKLELLADSVTSQVHDNLFKLAHTESIGMHIASLMQGHTDTNRLCNYFFLSFAHLELHQTNNPAIHTKQETHYQKVLTHTCTHAHTQHTDTHTLHTHTHSPEGHGSRCVAEAEKDSFEYQQRATALLEKGCYHYTLPSVGNS